MKNLMIAFGLTILGLTTDASILDVTGDDAEEIFFEMPVRSIREGNYRSREIASKFLCYELLSAYTGIIHSCRMYSYMPDLENFVYIYGSQISTNLYQSLKVQVREQGPHRYKEVRGRLHCTRTISPPEEEDLYHCTLDSENK